MKKVCIVLLFGLFINSLIAQESKHEIQLGAGVLSTTEIASIFGDILTTGLTGGMYSSDETYSGALHLGYKYSVSERIAAGGTFVYENAHSDAYINNVRDGKFKNNYYTLAAEMDYKYLKKKNMTLYGTLGAGATLYSQRYIPDEGENSSNDVVNFNFQVSPIGIKFGNKIGGFAELGFGYKGILTVGFFTRF